MDLRHSRHLTGVLAELKAPQVVCFGFAVTLAGLCFGAPAVMGLCTVLLLFVPYCFRTDRGRTTEARQNDDELDQWKSAHASLSADLPPVVRLQAPSGARMRVKPAARQATVP